MLVNTEQRKGNIILSYINKLGEISYVQLTVPPNHQFNWGYSKFKAKSGDTPYISWDRKHVCKLPSDFLDKYRLQEFFIEAGEETMSKVFEMNMPNLYSLDIEVDVTDDGFSEASEAKNRINTIAWCHYPQVIVFGLKSLSGDQCKEIEDKINEHIKSFNKKYEFLYKEYSNEADMLTDFLFNYLKKAPLVTGWNLWGYDWLYILNRCKLLNIDITSIAPTKQWYNHTITDRGERRKILLPQHKLIVDYLSIYQKWDRSVDIKENDTLDYVAESALHINKVKYSGTFQDLYKEYDKYVFYNAIDAVIVELLDQKLKTMQTFLGLGNLGRVEAMSAFSPVQMLEALCARYGYSRGIVFPKNKNHNEKEEYEGAFVYEPTPGLYEWVASIDAEALYPTVMRQWKISIENLITKDKNYKINSNQTKCINGAVFDSTNEPLLTTVLTDLRTQRKEAKSLSLQAEKEANDLKNILNERLSKANAVLR